MDISGRPSPYPHPLRATPKRWALRLFRMVSAVLSTAATLHGLEWFQQGIPRTSKFLLIHRTLAFIIDRIGFSTVCTFSFSIHLWITFHRTCSLLSHFQASPPPQRHHGNRSFQSVQIKNNCTLPKSRLAMGTLPVRARRCMYMCMCVCVCVCDYVCMDGWMAGWMDAWMHACMRAYMYLTRGERKPEFMW